MAIIWLQQYSRIRILHIRFIIFVFLLIKLFWVQRYGDFGTLTIPRVWHLHTQ